MMIANVARDASVQQLLGGVERAAEVVRARGGGAFDPRVADCLADHADEILARDREASAWDETVAAEPHPRLTLEGAAIDRALAAMGAFADLVSPSFVGHSAGVAELAGAAAQRCHLDDAQRAVIRRAALVHDVGRVVVAPRVWNRPGPLSADEWERVRLHPYHTERVLSRSGSSVRSRPIAGADHERLDGSGYHRGATAAALVPAARLLAVADAYHAMIEPRPHREPLAPELAAKASPSRPARAARRRRRRRGARGCRPAGDADRASVRVDRAGGRGHLPARAWPADEAGGARAGHLGKDRRPAHPERLRQDRRLDPGGGGRVRHGARPRRMGRTPDCPLPVARSLGDKQATVQGGTPDEGCPHQRHHQRPRARPGGPARADRAARSKLPASSPATGCSPTTTTERTCSCSSPRRPRRGWCA